MTDGTDEHETLRECQRCHEEKPVYGEWRFNVCPECAGELDTVPLRKCSRCGFHRPDWQTTAAYCRECWREYQRERRARLKEEGRRDWTEKTCSQCQTVEDMPPESSWCRGCRNAYQRRWKAAHPNAVRRPPARTTPGREEMRQCSRCKHRRVYKGDWRGNICPQCQQVFRETAAQNERARIREWRGTGALIECRTCHQVKPYGRGWDGRLCRECQAIRAAKAYAAVKATPERLKRRKAKQEAARQRRIARKTAVWDRDGGMDAQDTPMPEIALQVPSPRDTAAVRAYVLAMAAQGKTATEIRDLTGYALGQIESTIKADARRRERENQDTVTMP